MPAISRKASKSAAKPVAPIVAPARAVTAKAAKAKPVAAPTVPAITAPDARSARLETLRGYRNDAVLLALYGGLSLTTHSHKPPTLAAYCERIVHPTKRASILSDRSTAELAKIVHYSPDAAAGYDPVTLGCDIGIASFFSSLGHVAVNAAGRPALTAAAVALGKAAYARAKAALAA